MPRYAALSSGILVGLGAAFNLASPLVGIISDRLGSRRPLLMAGALAVTIALVGMLLSVTGLFGDRTTFSFIFFCVAYLLMQSGITLVSVSFVGFICSVHPNTTAIGYVPTFNLLYHHLLYRHLLYRHVLYRHLLLSSLGNTYINTALTRPTVSFGRYNTRIGESEKIVCNSSYRCQT